MRRHAGRRDPRSAPPLRYPPRSARPSPRAAGRRRTAAALTSSIRDSHLNNLRFTGFKSYINFPGTNNKVSDNSFTTRNTFCGIRFYQAQSAVAQIEVPMLLNGIRIHMGTIPIILVILFFNLTEFGEARTTPDAVEDLNKPG